MIRTDDKNRILLGTEESPITTYLINAGGFIEGSLRAQSVAHWETAAEARRLLVRNEETDTLHPAEHVNIVGPYYPVITPAVLDAEGNITTPAVTDSRPHYDIRISPWAMQAPSSDGSMLWWEETALLWMANGTPITEAEKNKAEDGIDLNGITLLDRTTFRSPELSW